GGGGCPLDTVASVGFDLDGVAGRERARRFLVGEAEASRAGEEDDEFGFVLVVPEPVGAGLAVREDALDADRVSGRQGLDDLVGLGRGQVAEQVHRPAAARTPATARRQPVRRSVRSAGSIAVANRRSAVQLSTITAGGGQTPRTNPAT